MHANSLQELYILELKDLYSAEQQLLQALPLMAQAASSSDLKMGFQQHLEETRKQVERLQQIFSDLGQSPSGETCEAMQGLIQEGQEAIQLQGDPTVRDAALIASAQKVEHYEMAGYGTVRTFANHLGFDSHRSLLQQTLDEEGATDKKLTALAEGGMFSNGINEKAMDDRVMAGSR
jgi:ferritin-like metal-binding protein YciE